MTNLNSELPIGYSPVAPGQLANVVTCLEMRERPQRELKRDFPPPYRVIPLGPSDIGEYRALFRKIGENWLWHSRLTMPDEKLLNILGDPLVEAFALRNDAESVGLLELDFRHAGDCEVAFFGLAPTAIGGGLGRGLMDMAIARAWARPIKRLWVHTCHFDHPAALPFYIRSGFRPYAFQVEVQADPRLTGHLPRHVAPHVPLIVDAAEAAPNSGSSVRVG